MEDGDQVDAHLEQVCCLVLCMRVLTTLTMCSLVVMHSAYTRVCDRLSSVLASGFIIYYVCFLYLLSTIYLDCRPSSIKSGMRIRHLRVVLHLGQLSV